MLKFNNAGLLVPPTIIASSLVEFEEYFVIDSPEDIRRSLFNSYKIYKDKLKDVCQISNLKQWIDGSYVTKKERPLDMDIVSFINYEVFDQNEARLKEFIYPNSSIIYNLDGYFIKIYPEDHPLRYAYSADLAYWTNLFDRTKPDKRNKRMPKGFLEINV